MKTRYSLFRKSIPAVLVCGLALVWTGFMNRNVTTVEQTPLFVTDILVAGKQLLIAEKGSGRIALYTRDGKTRLREWKVPDTPTGMAVEGRYVWVTTATTHNGVSLIDLEGSGNEAEAFIPTASGACAPVIAPRLNRLYVCNRFAGTVSEIDRSARKVVRTVRVLREPNAAVLSQDGRHLFVTNFLPDGRADADIVAASVSVIDVETFRKVKDIQLANGSNALRGMALSPDGDYVFVTHNLGRFQVPTTQLQQGWMNTSALSVIHTRTLTYGGAVLLDEPDRGAAGVWDVACDTAHIAVTHSGTHELSVIDYKKWKSLYEKYADKEALSYDLRFLNSGDIRRRIPLKGNGPRAMALADGTVFAMTYFSDTLNVLPLGKTGTLLATGLVTNRSESPEQRGEKYFNDAMYCFQNWQSCNGCHPGDGRTDGMNWDLMNDGVGNPKNCKSMLYAHATPPCMISGIRENAEKAVRAGFKYIQFHEIPEDYAVCVDAYLKSLRPVPSPYLVQGQLSEKASRGKQIYEQQKCDKCHSGPYHTDQKTYRIGEDIEFEQGWDTPTLCEVWRTAPYLFDGRAATMDEVFSVHKHGLKGKNLPAKDIEALAEYVNSL